MNKNTAKIDFSKLQESDEDIYVKRSIFELPDIGEKIYGNSILNREFFIDKKDRNRVKITTEGNNQVADGVTFTYEFINDERGRLIENIFESANDHPMSWRPVEYTDGIF